MSDMRPDRQGEPRTARVARWLQFGLLVTFPVVALLYGVSPGSGWGLIYFAVVFLRLLEWAVLDEHRTRIAAGATEEEWARRYRGR